MARKSNQTRFSFWVSAPEHSDQRPIQPGDVNVRAHCPIAGCHCRVRVSVAIVFTRRHKHQRRLHDPNERCRRRRIAAMMRSKQKAHGAQLPQQRTLYGRADIARQQHAFVGIGYQEHARAVVVAARPRRRGWAEKLERNTVPSPCVTCNTGRRTRIGARARGAGPPSSTDRAKRARPRSSS